MNLTTGVASTAAYYAYDWPQSSQMPDPDHHCLDLAYVT
jgi:hypothetical protein